jgi:hypothetical protein
MEIRSFNVRNKLVVQFENKCYLTRILNTIPFEEKSFVKPFMNKTSSAKIIVILLANYRFD